MVVYKEMRYLFVQTYDKLEKSGTLQVPAEFKIRRILFVAEDWDTTENGSFVNLYKNFLFLR